MVADRMDMRRKDRVDTEIIIEGKSLDISKLRDIPNHVAIIMDGNRRWAAKRGLPTAAGHAYGVARLEPILEMAASLGISTVTFYSFSTENRSRPYEELDALFNLMREQLDAQTKKAVEKGLCLKFIGDLQQLPTDLQEKLKRAQEATKNGRVITAVFAINYGARNEIVRAAKKLATQVQKGMLIPEQINEDLMTATLDTGEYPDPQLFIRPSGEQRISNFLLWQLAYSELYFTPVHWPDFGPQQFLEALEVYQTRQRRFGV